MWSYYFKLKFCTLPWLKLLIITAFVIRITIVGIYAFKAVIIILQVHEFVYKVGAVLFTGKA